MAAYSSSSYSSAHVKRFHVFPSFHGPDVRRGFLSHLHNPFASKGITIFKDHMMERGRTIGRALNLAISESRISIVLLSKNYASSKWCLDELVEILKCRKDQGQIVMPIFYDVDPWHVRKQLGEFGKAFEKTCKGETEEKKRRWIEALENVANISGEHSRNWPNEAAMIEKLAIDVSNIVYVEERKEAFRVFDVDHDGFITAAEFQYVMTIHGEKVTYKGACKFIRKADADGDGRISYDEFVKLNTAKMFYKLAAKRSRWLKIPRRLIEKFATDVSNKLDVEDLKEAFRDLDVDQNGFISAAELRYVMTIHGKKVTDRGVCKFIRKADVDGNGQINYDEFVKLMMTKMTDEEVAMVKKFATDVPLSWEEKKEMKEIFTALDVDQNGFITAAEFQCAKKNQGEKVTDEGACIFIQAADVDGDGRMNFDEFVKFNMAK